MGRDELGGEKERELRRHGVPSLWGGGWWGKQGVCVLSSPQRPLCVAIFNPSGASACAEERVWCPF